MMNEGLLLLTPRCCCSDDGVVDAGVVLLLGNGENAVCRFAAQEIGGSSVIEPSHVGGCNSGACGRNPLIFFRTERTDPEVVPIKISRFGGSRFARSRHAKSSKF